MNRPNRNQSTRVINEHAKANDFFFCHLVCLWCIPVCIIMGNVCMIAKFTLLVSRLLLVCRRATPQLNKQSWETIWRNGPQTQLPNMFASIGSRVAWSLLSTNLAKKNENFNSIPASWVSGQFTRKFCIFVLCCYGPCACFICSLFIGGFLCQSLDLISLKQRSIKWPVPKHCINETL